MRRERLASRAVDVEHVSHNLGEVRHDHRPFEGCCVLCLVEVGYFAEVEVGHRVFVLLYELLVVLGHAPEEVRDGSAEQSFAGVACCGEFLVHSHLPCRRLLVSVREATRVDRCLAYIAFVVEKVLVQELGEVVLSI